MDMDKERGESHKPLQIDRLAREKVFLAGQASEGGLKVLPGKSWAFHYPNGGEARKAAISGLISGNVGVEEAVGDLKPDVLIYSSGDLDQQGLPTVSARVRDVSAYVTHYDYPRFAKFLSGVRGTDISPDTAQSIYDGIAQSRIRRKMIDAYGSTGRKQMEEALRLDAERTAQQIGGLPRVEKVFAALKMNWLTEDLQLTRSEQRDQVIGQLSKDEGELYEELRDSYQEYVRRGGEAAYESLVNGIKENIPRIQQETEPEKDESQERLEKELEPYMNENDISPMPGMSRWVDNEISPAKEPKNDGYVVYAEITPSGTAEKPMVGYYIGTRSSKYDIDTKSWIPERKLNPYSQNIQGDNRQTRKSTVGDGLSYVHVPNGYGLDMSSLKFTGSNPEIFRDQNGCFYIKTDGECNYSIDFLKEDTLVTDPPTDEDTKLMHRGLLAPETENMLASLTGDNITKAEQISSYVLDRHYYPGDGDLKQAAALQRKLGMESTGDNYIQNLEKSEYLECLSASNLFIAMNRKAGIPTRLDNGHKVEGAKDGKARIDSQTGHAWAEVWDGRAWRRMDATPRAKQPKEDHDQSSASEEAQDGGIDRQDQGQPSEEAQGKPQQGQSQQGQGSQHDESMPGQQMGEASDQDVEQGESELSRAQQFSEAAQQQKHSMDQKVKNAQSFQDLKRLEQEAENSDLFDDMKQDLQHKLEAKEQQMKESIKESLDEMLQDGFLDEERQQELEKQLDQKGLEELDRIRQQIELESRLFNEYQDIKEEVMPFVDRWFDYFVERLPRQEEVELDEDSLTRQGAFNRHSVMKPRNLLFGTVKNPRMIRPSIRPKFISKVVVDVSGSMARDKTLTRVDLTKINNARKLLIFYNELFSRISDKYGYIRYSNDIFSDNVTELKTYDQDYNSPTRHDYSDGTKSTIKVHIMQSMHAQGGTDMLAAIQKAAKDLNAEIFEYPDYASALYFVGDGEDTYHNQKKIKEFLRLSEAEHGFGEHMLSAIMLGNESQRRELAEIFGDEHTTVAPDFETLIEQSMYKFDEDIQAYLRDKTI